MLKKIFIAVFMMTMVVAQNVSAEEVTVYVDKNNTTYCVDDLTIEYTNMYSDSAFKVKVVSYYKTYSPQYEWYFFEEEEDGTTAYVVGEGGRAYTVRYGDEPAYSVYQYCKKYLGGELHHDEHNHKHDPYYTGE